MKRIWVACVFAAAAAAQNPVLRDYSCTAASAAGTDTYACSAAVAPASYAAIAGKLVCFTTDVANTGAATFNLSSLGAVAIKKVVGAATTGLETGDIAAAQFVCLRHDGTYWQLQSPSAREEHSINGQWGDISNTTALTAGTTVAACKQVRFGGTIYGWVAQVSPGGASATFKFLKNSSGTANPTVTDSINTSGVGISSNTTVTSTTLTDFSSAVVVAGENWCVNLSGVSGSPMYAAIQLLYR